MEDALGLAAASAAGLLTYCERGDYSKSFNVGKAAMNGIIAGVSAVNGGTAPYDSLDIENGYCYSYEPAHQPKLEEIDKNLGTEWTILRNTPKIFPHIACGHSPVENVLAILKENDLKPEDIEKIVHRTYQLQYEVFNNRDPRTSLAARLSPPFCTAVAAALGKMDMGCFSEDENGVFNPKIRLMLERVEMVPDARATSLFPQYIPSFMTITTKDGRSFYREVMNPKGHADNPATLVELENKFRENVIPVLGPVKTEAYIEECRNLEKLSNIGELTRQLMK